MKIILYPLLQLLAALPFKWSLRAYRVYLYRYFPEKSPAFYHHRETAIAKMAAHGLLLQTRGNAVWAFDFTGREVKVAESNDPLEMWMAANLFADSFRN